MNEQNKKAAVDTGEKSIKARLFGDRKSGRAGGYTVLMTVVLLAALIVVNLIINALPANSPSSIQAPPKCTPSPKRRRSTFPGLMNR